MVCDIPLKSSQRKLQLCFRLHLNWRFTHKIMGPQSRGSPKWHMGASPMAKYRVYYKVKVVASLKFRPWWVLWVCGCSWLVHAPKCSKYALINLLLGLCKSMWVSELLVNLPSPILELQHIPLPLKCCELGNAPKHFLLPLFSALDSQFSPSRSLGCIIDTHVREKKLQQTLE